MSGVKKGRARTDRTLTAVQWQIERFMSNSEELSNLTAKAL